MGLKKRSKSISRITKTLLRDGENERVDYKKIPEGVNSEDLVAFANSPNGGHILTGVAEVASSKGPQQGTIIGCDVSDAIILQILNKAVNCVPPISVDIFIENLDRKPLLRIFIPPSESKPHCTSKGVYCIREGNRNRALHPAELLRVFLDTEARAFANRFQAAANKITKHMLRLETSMETSIRSMSQQLGWTETKLDDTESTLDSIYDEVSAAAEDIEDVNNRMRALFKQDARVDPVRNTVRDALLKSLIDDFLENLELLREAEHQEQLELQISGRTSRKLDKARRELDAAQIQDIIKEAVKQAAKRSVKK